MKYIERSNQKSNFSPWRLVGQKPCGEDEQGVSRRRNTLGRMPHLPLSTLVAGEEDWVEVPITVEKERD
jgi:hypothetical protein